MTPECGTPRQRTLPLALLTAGTVAGLVTALAAPTAAMAAPPTSSPDTTLQVVEVIDTDVDADGVPDQRRTVTVERSTRGVLQSVSDTIVELSTGEVTFFRVETYEYTDDGRTSLVTIERGAGDTVEQREYVAFFYDGRGEATQIVQEVDSNADGVIDSSNSVTTSGSARDLQTISTFVLDLDGDGSLDVSTVTTFTFDRRGNLLELRQETDNDVDGTVDQTDVVTVEYSQRGQTLLQTVTTTNSSGTSTFEGFLEYNPRGFLTHERSFQNGILSSEQAVSYTARGSLSTAVMKFDTNSDGVLDEFTTTHYRYDKRGNPSGATTETRTADGALLFSRELVLESDARGTVTLARETDDRDGDGIADSVTTTATELDARGRVVRETFVQDANADGVVDSGTTTVTLFAADSTVLQRVKEFDVDGDGVADSIVTFTYPLR